MLLKIIRNKFNIKFSPKKPIRIKLRVNNHKRNNISERLYIWSVLHNRNIVYLIFLYYINFIIYKILHAFKNNNILIKKNNNYYFLSIIKLKLSNNLFNVILLLRNFFKEFSSYPSTTHWAFQFSFKPFLPTIPASRVLAVSWSP
jgi:hypothetical protein